MCKMLLRHLKFLKTQKSVYANGKKSSVFSKKSKSVKFAFPSPFFQKKNFKKVTQNIIFFNGKKNFNINNFKNTINLLLNFKNIFIDMNFLKNM